MSKKKQKLEKITVTFEVYCKNTGIDSHSDLDNLVWFFKQNIKSMRCVKKVKAIEYDIE